MFPAPPSAPLALPAPPKSPFTLPPRPEPARTLSLSEELMKTLKDKYGITDKRTYRKWTLANHPDKGGDTGEFADVSRLVDRLKELNVIEFKFL